MDPD
jgi:hypothetical protein